MIKRISELENFAVWEQLREHAIGVENISNTGSVVFRDYVDKLRKNKFSDLEGSNNDLYSKILTLFSQSTNFEDNSEESLKTFLDSIYAGSNSNYIVWDSNTLKFNYGHIQTVDKTIVEENTIIVSNVPADIKEKLDILNAAYSESNKISANPIHWAPRTIDADIYDPEIRGIQKQIVWNIDALLSGENVENSDEIYFWGGRKWNPKTLSWIDLEDYPNSDYGRFSQVSSEGGKFVYPFTMTSAEKLTSSSQVDNGKNTPPSTDQFTTQLPILNANKAYLELSEFNTDGAAHSNYVSRKVPLIWLFNVIKALQGLKNKFTRLILGNKVKSLPCSLNAESDPDLIKEETPHKPHTFERSTNPAVDGRLKVYGNAELNGEITTFHCETRFHEPMYIWETMNVYGSSYFSKDINGTAMRCRWADLAEYYEADDDYAPGTLVRFGGDKEITIADELNLPNAIVTTKPGLTLNSPKEKDDKKMVGVVLTGRSPIRVIGKVKKFDKLYLSRIPGVAVSAKNGTGTPIAIALESNDSENEKLVEAVSKLTF